MKIRRRSRASAGDVCDLVPVALATGRGDVGGAPESHHLEVESGEAAVQPVGGGGVRVAGQWQQVVGRELGAGGDQHLVLLRAPQGDRQP